MEKGNVTQVYAALKNILDVAIKQAISGVDDWDWVSEPKAILEGIDAITGDKTTTNILIKELFYGVLERSKLRIGIHVENDHKELVTSDGGEVIFAEKFYVTQVESAEHELTLFLADDANPEKGDLWGWLDVDVSHEPDNG